MNGSSSFDLLPFPPEIILGPLLRLIILYNNLKIVSYMRTFQS